MKGKFDKRREAYHKLENKLALDIYEDMLGDELKLIKKAPQYWFKMEGNVSVSIGGCWEYLYFGYVKKDERILLPMPHEIGRKSTQAQYNGKHPFAKRLQTIQKQKESVEKEETDMHFSILAMLDSVSTVKKLRDSWPEIVPTIDLIVGTPDQGCGGLPAVPIANLNKLLGLKKVVVKS